MNENEFNEIVGNLQDNVKDQIASLIENASMYVNEESRKSFKRDCEADAQVVYEHFNRVYL